MMKRKCVSDSDDESDLEELKCFFLFGYRHVCLFKRRWRML